MEKLNDQELLKWANNSAYEAQWAARKWREESWRSSELYDGGESSWTQEDWNAALDAGIEPITTNRVFPAVNKLLGSQIVGRFEIVAKGRTQKDGEIGKVMSEGVKFVMDQYMGEFIVSHAYRDAVIPGIGCVSPCFNSDPRQERVMLKYKPWTTIWWDPYSDPWWTPQKTRYVFEQPWVDLEDFKTLFPEKRQEIQNAYDETSGQWRESGYSNLMDEAQQIEEQIRTLSASDWVDARRKRIRPIHMWYPVNEMAVFALYPDGRCFEIKKDMDSLEAYQIVINSQQILKSNVKKMKGLTFFGEHLILQDIYSPYNHDQYPLVPFVGYVDRWGFPYGVPRQIAGQQEEVLKRRSMALALMQKRRVTVEKDAVTDGDQDQLDALYEEANKLDGFMVLAPGGLKKFQIEELANLSPHQINLLNQAEFEIRDIAGSDTPVSQAEQAQSGVAKQQDAAQASITTASLPDNLRRSMGILGEQIIANIQQAWKYEKVLRVTDRLTGAERFITVNQPLGGGIEVKNNITQGKYDTVVSEVPATDTMREKNLEILYSAIQKSPPEAVPTLLIAAFEMSDLPNKELLLERLKPVMGMQPDDDTMDPQEAKQQAMQALEAQQQEQQMQKQLQMEAAKLELNEKRLKNLETEAKIRKLQAEADKIVVDTELEVEGADVDNVNKIIDMHKKILEPSNGQNDRGTIRSQS